VAGAHPRGNHRWVAVELVAPLRGRADVDVDLVRRPCARDDSQLEKASKWAGGAQAKTRCRKYASRAYPNYYPGAGQRLPVAARAKTPSDRRYRKRSDLESNGAGAC